MRKEMLQKFFEQSNFGILFQKENFVHEYTGYSPLHWLAFHDDYLSTKYLLDIMKEKLLDTMLLTKKYGLTPIDIAGR